VSIGGADKVDNGTPEVEIEELDVRKEAMAAAERIRPHIRETPLEHSPWLSRLSGGEVYLKLENLQITGSFKLRGAANKLLSLSERQRQQGLVTASTGNHGAAVAHLLGKFDWPGIIFVPEQASGAKVEQLRESGVDLRFHGQDGVETERFARQMAAESGRVYVSPYNDPKIVGGQGTVGLELEHQLEDIDSLVVPVGGGGLMAGVAGTLKSSQPDIEIIGCQPKNSCVMYHSIAAGRIVDLESLPTLADGTAGGIEVDTLTLPICSRLVDDWLLVSEEEIAEAIRLVIRKHFLLIEGAAALSVAAFLKTVEWFAGRRVVLVLSGAKLDIEALRSLC
jgi:threonine dehydratase